MGFAINRIKNGGGQRGRWLQGGCLKNGGVFAGGWAAFGREGKLKFGVKEGGLQDGSLSGPRVGGESRARRSIVLSGEGRISGGGGGGLIEPMMRKKKFLF